MFVIVLVIHIYARPPPQYHTFRLESHSSVRIGFAPSRCTSFYDYDLLPFIMFVILPILFPPSPLVPPPSSSPGPGRHPSLRTVLYFHRSFYSPSFLPLLIITVVSSIRYRSSNYCAYVCRSCYSASFLLLFCLVPLLLFSRIFFIVSLALPASPAPFHNPLD